MNEEEEEEVKQIAENLKPLVPFMILGLYMKSLMPTIEKANNIIIEQEMKRYEISRRC